MGTTCTVAVCVAPGDEAVARRALEAGCAEVAACEHALSRFDAASDLSTMNHADGRWVAIGGRLQAALAAALDARAATGGRFDPTVLPALVAAGYDRSFEQLEHRTPAPPANWRAGAVIELDPVAGLARVERGAAVDLGGIGKGWSAGSALERMGGAWPGAPGFLVDLGGDIAVSGVAPHGGPWLIDVADSRRLGTAIARIKLADGGVATSGRDTRRFGPDARLHHLIDPETGLPAASGPLAVTVVAPDAAQAEAHATALAITPVDEAPAYIAERPDLAALLIPDTGPPVVLGELPLVAVEQRRVRINLATPNGELS
jgi:thiamine biosynthesis lipoprotein